MSAATLYVGSATAIPLPDQSVQCVVTSPPYWGLRRYDGDQVARWSDAEGVLGMEPTPDLYVAHLLEIFREVSRVLRPDGSLWLNIGDSYAKARAGVLKPKELAGIPWRVAFALQAAGWLLRADIIWSKPSVMPSSVKDRPTRSHEYVFLLTRSDRYYYDADAIREPLAASTLARLAQNGGNPKLGSARERRGRGRIGGADTLRADQLAPAAGRNARTVWEIANQSYRGAHFATFPPEIAKRAILAGSRQGDLVLDPFVGSGTSGVVAVEHGRRFVGVDISEEYVRALAAARIPGAEVVIS